MTAQGPTSSHEDLDAARRMKLQYVINGIAALILVTVILPTDARAKSGYIVHPASTELILPIRKKAGYVMSVSAGGHRVQFKLDGTSLEVEYSTEGNISSQRIKADFGVMGRINVRLHLVRHPPDPPHKGRCKGRAPLYQEGSYRGIIEITNLGSNAPIASVKSGHVYFIRRFRQVCKRQRTWQKVDGKRLKREVSILTVNGQTGERLILLQALNLTSIKNPVHSRGYLSATVFERLEGIRVTRRVGTPINHDSFALSPRGAALEIADLELPRPFVGHAVYSRSPNTSPSWTGDLSVELPVVGNVPLTGLGFSAILCRAVSVATLEFCS